MARPKKAEVQDRIAGLDSAISSLQHRLDALADEMGDIGTNEDGEPVIDLRAPHARGGEPAVVDLTDSAEDATRLAVDLNDSAAD